MLKRIIRYKVYYDRGTRYWNYVKTIVVIAVAYKVFEDSEIGLFLYKYRVIVIPLSVLFYFGVSVLAGYIDKETKIRELEIGEYNKTDPNLRSILSDLIYIKQKLDDNSTGGKPPQ